MNLAAAVQQWFEPGILKKWMKEKEWGQMKNTGSISRTIWTKINTWSHMEPECHSASLWSWTHNPCYQQHVLTQNSALDWQELWGDFTHGNEKYTSAWTVINENVLKVLLYLFSSVSLSCSWTPALIVLASLLQHTWFIWMAHFYSWWSSSSKMG